VAAASHVGRCVAARLGRGQMTLGQLGSRNRVLEARKVRPVSVTSMADEVGNADSAQSFLARHEPELLLALDLIAPVRGEAVAKFVERRRSRRFNAIQTMSNALRADLGDRADELLEGVLADDRRLALFDRAVEAAARTALHGKARMLGRALASGALASDDAELDRAELRLEVIADLEAPHVKVLELLEAILVTRTRTVDASARVRPDSGEILDESAPTPAPDSGVKLDSLRREATGLGGGLHHVLAVLERNGLIVQTDTAIGAIRYVELSEFGIEMLRYLRENGS
jgi:hypothetical protein